MRITDNPNTRSSSSFKKINTEIPASPLLMFAVLLLVRKTLRDRSNKAVLLLLHIRFIIKYIGARARAPDLIYSLFFLLLPISIRVWRGTTVLELFLINSLSHLTKLVCRRRRRLFSNSVKHIIMTTSPAAALSSFFYFQTGKSEKGEYLKKGSANLGSFLPSPQHHQQKLLILWLGK